MGRCHSPVSHFGQIILVVLIGLAFPTSAKEAPQPTLESVMASLARSGGVEARFRESRQLTILSEPIESAGMLYFAPPDSLARHVEEPGESRIIVRADRVSFQDETGTQTLELGSSEVARAMVGNVMVLMRGDLDALRKDYEIRFDVADGLWNLDLEPRDRIVKQMIERLRVTGSEGQLIRMETVETSGDITRTEFLDVKVGFDYSDSSRDEIFYVRDGGTKGTSVASDRPAR